MFYEADTGKIRGVINRKDDGPGKLFEMGKIQRNKWVDFVLHVKWSSTSAGLTEVWVDGQKKVDHQGPNVSAFHANDKNTRTSVQIGVYKSSGIPIDSKLYIDELRLAANQGSYNAVKPGASGRGPTPPAPPTPPTEPPAPKDFPVSGTWYSLKNAKYGGLIDTQGEGKLTLWPQENSTAEDVQFRFLSAGNGYWRIDNRKPGRGQLDTSTSGLVQWKETESSNEDDKVWSINKQSDGTYRFVNKRSGRGALVGRQDSSVGWSSSTDDLGSRWVVTPIP